MICAKLLLLYCYTTRLIDLIFDSGVIVNKSILYLIDTEIMILFYLTNQLSVSKFEIIFIKKSCLCK